MPYNFNDSIQSAKWTWPCLAEKGKMNNQLNGILLFWCPILNFPTFSHFFSFLNLSFAFSFYFLIYHLLLLSISQSIICFFSILFLFSLFIILLFLFYSLVFFLSFCSFLLSSLILHLLLILSNFLLFLFLPLPSLPLPYPLSFIHTYLAARALVSVFATFICSLTSPHTWP